MKPPAFSVIEEQDFPRRETFGYFSQMAPTGYSLTAKWDVTALRKTVRNAEIKFYPAYLWLVTKALCAQQEFRLACLDGRLVCYDVLTPFYAVFHEDDKTFSMMWTEFDERFPVFYERFLTDRDRYGENHGFLSKKDAPPPPNAYTVSCLPWITFRHFSVHSYEKKAYYFPSVEAGKWEEKAGRTLLPLSVTCHHAAADGWHVARFLHDVQEMADQFEKYL